MEHDEENVQVRFDQRDIFATPTFFVDGPVGIATAAGIARVTFGAFKINMTEGAVGPTYHPVVTLAISEAYLLAFAREMVARAAANGVEIDDDDAPR